MLNFKKWTSARIIKNLPLLSITDALRLDIFLHDISNEYGQKYGAVRRTWIKSLKKDTVIKKGMLKLFESRQPVCYKDWNKFWNIIYIDRSIHKKYLNGKYLCTRATGNKIWHDAWIKFYNRLEFELLLYA